MIVTRTPFRITLGGGGTDLPAYYREHGGFCLTATINRYMYVSVNRPALEHWVRVHYTRWEEVEKAADLKHDLAREALRFYGIKHGIEISSVADLPAGTGLGSSAAYLVGLLAALYFQGWGEIGPTAALASSACYVEMERLGRPVGKQDQYAVASGGMNAHLFSPTEGVTTIPLKLGLPERVFEERVRLYYTGRQRDTALALAPLAQSLNEKGSGVFETLHRIKALALESKRALCAGDLDWWGGLLHEQWQEKRTLSCETVFGQHYDYLRAAHGVIGGKVVGAGNGGFLMLVVPQGTGAEFDRVVNLPRLDYRLETAGVQVLAHD